MPLGSLLALALVPIVFLLPFAFMASCGFLALPLVPSRGFLALPLVARCFFLALALVPVCSVSISHRISPERSKASPGQASNHTAVKAGFRAMTTIDGAGSPNQCGSRVGRCPLALGVRSRIRDRTIFSEWPTWRA